ncbi:hypothetical protein BCEN4_1560004 [Burkholderia cenocepacia]|nr:hypothetical protein BCEN4_1560004 [Burkholderia cenocepacia]
MTVAKRSAPQPAADDNLATEPRHDRASPRRDAQADAGNPGGGRRHQTKEANARASWCDPRPVGRPASRRHRYCRATGDGRPAAVRAPRSPIVRPPRRRVVGCRESA